MFKKILYIAILLLASQQIMAQGKGKIKKADKLYEGYSYAKAIEKYEGITDKSPEILRNLADSYFHTGDYGKSESTYAKLCTLDKAKAEDVYNYAFVLKINEKYTESQNWMRKYSDLKSGDSRATALVKETNYYSKLQKDNGQFTVSNLDINTNQEDFGTAFYKNKIVLASSREGVVPVKRRWNWNKLPFLNLYEAERNDDNTLKTPKKFVRRLNKKYHEGPASFNEAGDFVVFTRNNYKGKSKDGIIKLQLFTSKLEGKSWSKPKAVPFNSSEYSVGHPALSADGLTMYFASDMPGGSGGVDLYIVTRSKEGAWNVPKNLGDLLNTEGDEMFPFISANAELLFFASNGHPGLGGLDVFVSKMENTEPVEFKNVGVPVNTSKDDFAFILDKELKGGYFSSNRPGGKGDDDIYSYVLNKPFLFNKVIKGTVKDNEGNLLANTEINLYDEKGAIVKTVTTDASGEYSFQADNDKKYSLKGIKDKYDNGKNVADTHGDVQVIVADLVLAKVPDLSLVCIVKDADGNLLDGVNIAMTNVSTNKKESVYTQANGQYRKPLKGVRNNDLLNYRFVANKDKYLQANKSFQTKVNREGEYIVEITLLKLKVGSKLSDFIKIEPILFNFNKYNIRPDASVELEKIIKIMNEHPTMVIELGSHTDCRGGIKSNTRLSDRRAKASAKYIKSRITKPERIYGKGYGETELKVSCGCNNQSKPHNLNDAQHQENRRTEFKIISM